MKQILYAITKSNFGGAQRYVYELATRSKEAGFGVTVACGGNGLLKTKLELAGIKVYSIEGSQRDISITKELKVLKRLYAIIKEVRPDILHVNSPKLGGLGSLVGRMLRVKKIIYTNHGWPFQEERPFWQIILIKFFSWMTVMLAHRTIVLTRTEYNMVRHWLACRGKLSIIRLGLLDFNLLEKDDAIMRLFGETKAIELIKKNTRIIGMLAELNKNKGIIYAIEGMRQYKDFVGPNMNTHLVVFGDGELHAELAGLIQRLGLSENITLAGYIPDGRTYLKAFDFFLLSSIKEGLPYAILEAGNAKTPIISTNVGGISEVIENLRTGFLIKPRQAQEIKNVLNYIDEHAGEARQYAEGLYEKVKGEYDFENQFAKILALMNA